MRLLAAFLLLLLPGFAWAVTRQTIPAGTLATSGDGGRVPPDAAPELPELPALAFEQAAPLLPDPAPLAMPEPSFLESIGITFMKNSRGERNNNPGNIRISPINWQGKVAGVDKSFETFADPRAGIRALAVNLRTYQNVHGLNTVRQIITRWAPASENDTGAYVRAVAAALGVGPDDAINLADRQTLADLVTAIIKHENGRVIYAHSEIIDAVNAA
jgi:hypothetical protein